jgi:glycosyltransferase involved in cell wall biosynthesis
LETAAREVALLGSLQGALAPSATLARSLHLRAPALTSWVVEPAIAAAPRIGTIDVESAPLSALLIGHLVPNKGVLPLLRALAEPALASAPFRLRCVGRTDLDPAYARACADVLQAVPTLAARVTLVGALSLAEVRAELGRAEVLISASLGESFGMAIADARASGLPVLARRGGHVDVLVTAAAGCALVADEAALAGALVALAEDPAERARRRGCAESARLSERSWDDVADAVRAIDG